MAKTPGPGEQRRGRASKPRDFHVIHVGDDNSPQAAWLSHSMDGGGRYRWDHVGSYAPRLTLHAPKALPACRAMAVVLLPPALYYDPYTAQLPSSVSATLLGPLELEKPVGWTKRTQRLASVEKVPRMWWEGAQEQGSEQPCEGDACEHAALLLDFGTMDNISVPLHVRYIPPSAFENEDATWLGAMSLPTWLPEAAQQAWHAVRPGLQRGLRSARAWCTRHYARVNLLPEEPLFFSACPERQPSTDADELDASLFLPSTHAQIHASFERHMAPYILYEPPSAPRAETTSTAHIPIGDASLASVVQLATLGAIALASYMMCQSIFWARRSAH